MEVEITSVRSASGDIVFAIRSSDGRKIEVLVTDEAFDDKFRATEAPAKLSLAQENEKLRSFVLSQAARHLEFYTKPERIVLDSESFE
jgi:hypothetical protein